MKNPESMGCPCGSGLEYRRCCAHRVTAAGIRAHRRQSLLELERSTTRQILHWVWREHGTRLLQRTIFPDLGDEQLALLVPWAAYDTGYLPAFLAAHPRICSAERDWLVAQSEAYIGIWQVLDVQPGHQVHVRDRLTGREHWVWEQSATHMVIRDDHLIGRVTHLSDVSVFTGLYPVPLAPGAATAVVRRLQAITSGRAQPLSRADTCVAALQATRAVLSAHAELRSTDGETLVEIEDRFAIDPEVVPDLVARLADRPRAVVLSEAAPAVIQLHDSIPGCVVIHNEQVLLHASNLQHANQFRAELLQTGLLHFVQRESSCPSLSAAKPGQPSVAPTPSTQRRIQASLEAHYGEWLNRSLPALRGKTPQQAARTPQGRAQLASVLRDLAWKEARKAPWQRYGADRLRTKLGLTA